MQFLRSAAYDPATRTLTVHFRSPSGTSWAAYEYQDVAADLYERLRAAQPHAHGVVEREVAPTHAVRRVGEHTWHRPEPRD